MFKNNVVFFGAGGHGFQPYHQSIMQNKNTMHYVFIQSADDGGHTGELGQLFDLLASGDYRNNIALFAQLNKLTPIEFDNTFLAELLDKSIIEIPEIKTEGQLIEILLNASVKDLNKLHKALNLLLGYIEPEQNTEISEVIHSFADKYIAKYSQVLGSDGSNKHKIGNIALAAIQDRFGVRAMFDLTKHWAGLPDNVEFHFFDENTRHVFKGETKDGIIFGEGNADICPQEIPPQNHTILLDDGVTKFSYEKFHPTLIALANTPNTLFIIPTGSHTNWAGYLNEFSSYICFVNQKLNEDKKLRIPILHIHNVTRGTMEVRTSNLLNYFDNLHKTGGLSVTSLVPCGFSDVVTGSIIAARKIAEYGSEGKRPNYFPELDEALYWITTEFDLDAKVRIIEKYIPALQVSVTGNGVVEAEMAEGAAIQNRGFRHNPDHMAFFIEELSKRNLSKQFNELGILNKDIIFDALNEANRLYNELNQEFELVTD